MKRTFETTSADVRWQQVNQFTAYNHIITDYGFNFENVSFYLHEQYNLDESTMLVHRVSTYASGAGICQNLRTFEGRSRSECDEYVAEICNFVSAVLQDGVL